MAVITSILESVKKNLGLFDDDDTFDQDIMMHINSTFFTLNQLGIGPSTGFSIDDDTTQWYEFIGTDKNLNIVKTYIYMKVRLLFDPPTTSFAITSMEKTLTEMEWRINVYRENLQNISNGLPEGVPTLIPASTIWDLTGGQEFPAEAPLGALGIDLLTGDVYTKG